jgi:organic radical activating enzyme
MNNKPSLRLIVTQICNRACHYCANTKYDSFDTVEIDDLDDYGQLVLTGGEPMIIPHIVMEIVKRYHHEHEIFMYTQIPAPAYHVIFNFLSGVTVTLHDKLNLRTLAYYEDFIQQYTGNCNWRLYLMPEMHDTEYNPDLWDVVRKIEILDECPCPEDYLKVLTT